MLHALLETTLHVHARVGRGAKLLDRHRPGWADEIDVKKLDVADKYDCPLGQVYSTYLDGCANLGIISRHQSCRHGFFVSLLGWLVPPLRRSEYSCLRDAWVAAIRERTAPKRPQARSLPRLCRTAEAFVATAANGAPLYALIE